MYKELIQRLRNCATQPAPCNTCDLAEDGSCSDTQMKQAADAIEELMRRCEQFQFMPLPAWIPVTERLPEENKDVLAIVQWKDDHEVTMCYGRYKKKWYLWNGDLGELLKGFDVTHWMPFPAPPKEET